MKGAIGNAFLLNIVITFILIFFSLLIGSMAYSKAYKVKKFLINAVTQYEDKYGTLQDMKKYQYWNDMVNPYLSKIGYNISSKKDSCPSKTNYSILKNTSIGDYEYCIYYSNKDYNKTNTSTLLKSSENYLVLVYMKLDLPVVGSFLKMPLTGETKTFYKLK